MCRGPELTWSKALKGLPLQCGWGFQGKGQNGGRWCWRHSHRVSWQDLGCLLQEHQGFGNDELGQEGTGMDGRGLWRSLGHLTGWRQRRWTGYWWGEGKEGIRERSHNWVDGGALHRDGKCHQEEDGVR